MHPHTQPVLSFEIIILKYRFCTYKKKLYIDLSMVVNPVIPARGLLRWKDQEFKAILSCLCHWRPPRLCETLSYTPLKNLLQNNVCVCVVFVCCVCVHACVMLAATLDTSNLPCLVFTCARDGWNLGIPGPFSPTESLPQPPPCLMSDRVQHLTRTR